MVISDFSIQLLPFFNKDGKESVTESFCSAIELSVTLTELLCCNNCQVSYQISILVLDHLIFFKRISFFYTIAYFVEIQISCKDFHVGCLEWHLKLPDMLDIEICL